MTRTEPEKEETHNKNIEINESIINKWWTVWIKIKFDKLSWMFCYRQSPRYCQRQNNEIIHRWHLNVPETLKPNGKIEVIIEQPRETLAIMMNVWTKQCFGWIEIKILWGLTKWDIDMFAILSMWPVKFTAHFVYCVSLDIINGFDFTHLTYDSGV